jgi:hypothetical protein
MSAIGMQGAKGLALTGVGGITLVRKAQFHYPDFCSTFPQTFHKSQGGAAWAATNEIWRPFLTMGRD